MTTAVNKNDSGLIGLLIGTVIVAVVAVSHLAWWLVRRAPAEVSWIAVTVYAVLALNDRGDWVPLAVLALVLLVLVMVARRWYPRVAYVVPGWSVWRRRSYRVARRAGNGLLRDFGFVPSSDETVYNTLFWSGRGDWYIDARIGALSDPQHVEDVLRDGIAYVAGARHVRVIPGDRPGRLKAEFRTDVPENALDLPREIDVLPALDVERMAVPWAYGEDGLPRDLVLKGTSGVVIGGVPGSGKTAGMTTALAPLAASPYVQLYVIDGKAGADWSAFRDVAHVYLPEDEDLAAVRDVLAGVLDEMRRRVSSVTDEVESNWWNRGRSEDEPLLLVVMDEVQSYFETHAGMSKDDKALVGEITQLVSTLIKKGRSAGVVVICMTQKPTSEALPTRIRDNCGLRVAFRVTTSEAEQSVLGPVPDDARDVRATAIPPSRIGGAVVAMETGGREFVRTYYLPEKTARSLLAGVNQQ